MGVQWQFERELQLPGPAPAAVIVADSATVQLNPTAYATGVTRFHVCRPTSQSPHTWRLQ